MRLGDVSEDPMGESVDEDYEYCEEDDSDPECFDYCEEDDSDPECWDEVDDDDFNNDLEPYQTDKDAEKSTIAETTPEESEINDGAWNLMAHSTLLMLSSLFLL
jgi:hypothetical protein